MTDNYLGYGSLISPSVVAAYFSDNRAEKVEEKYSQEFPDNESVLIEDFVEKWEELNDDIEMIPVKVDGMERS